MKRRTKFEIMRARRLRAEQRGLQRRVQETLLRAATIGLDFAVGERIDFFGTAPVIESIGVVGNDGKEIPELSGTKVISPGKAH